MTSERYSLPERITNHDHCIMCGELNQLSLRLKFLPDGGGGVSAPFLGNSLLQGYDGILHGGSFRDMRHITSSIGSGGGWPADRVDTHT